MIKMTDRIFNFSAGPAVLPVEVLEQVREELLNHQGSGMSVMEMSHRSAEYKAIIEGAEAVLRKLLGINNDYDVLFLQGGASQQFAMIPMNLAGKDKTVDFIHTGSWTKKAIDEAKTLAQVHIAASTQEGNFKRLPKADEIKLSDNPAYVHLCSNNTIAGTEWKTFPDVGEVPLVADMSSDILSRPVDVSRFGIIFAGAQKNMGPAGVTLVIIRKDLVEKGNGDIPAIFQYRTHAAAGSLYNTPPTLAIYILGLVAGWIEKQGGLDAMQKRNEEKAGLLYDAIEASDFYYCPIETQDRSLMNVVFRVRGDNEAIESKFVKEATAAGLSGLKGHRSVGGLRASIYNAQTLEGVQALVNFMQEFQKHHS